MVIDDARRVSEALGTGQHIDAPFGGTVKDVHASCRDEIERLRAELYCWRRIADVCAIAIGIPENDTSRLAVELYDKAVRGE